MPAAAKMNDAAPEGRNTGKRVAGRERCMCVWVSWLIFWGIALMYLNAKLGSKTSACFASMSGWIV